MFFKYLESYQQYLSVLVSFLLVVGNYALGQMLVSRLRTDFFEKSSYGRFHYAIFGNVFFNICSQLFVFFGLSSVAVFNVLGVALSVLGIYSMVSFGLKSSLILKSIRNYSWNNWSVVFLTVLLFGFVLLAIAPITNGDSLDYHLGVPITVLREGMFTWQPTWFHQGLSGIGEYSILLSIVFRAEQYSSLLQIASVLSILGLFFSTVEANENRPSGYRGELLLLFLSTPVLLFLVSSPKPQLIGIAISSFLFVKIIFQNFQFSLRNIFIVLVLSFYIISVKLNFILSAFVLLSIFFFQRKNEFMNKSFEFKIKSFVILLTVFLAIFGPIIYYKLSIEGTDLFSIIYPIPSNYPGQSAFLEYLKNYDDVKLPFPISLVVPSSFGVYSMILGLNLLFLLFIALKNRPRKDLLVYVLLLVVLSYQLGQKTSRFYFEPFVWTLLIINFSSEAYYRSNVLRVGIFLVSTVQLLVVVTGIASLTIGLYSLSKREEVMRLRANGYTLAEWANNVLPDSTKLLVEHRSLALFNQKVYSSDWIYFVNLDRGEDKFYTNYLAKENVSHILIVGENQSNSKLFRYCDRLVYGPFEGVVATRNPFNSGKKFKAWIYRSKFEE